MARLLLAALATARAGPARVVAAVVAAIAALGRTRPGCLLGAGPTRLVSTGPSGLVTTGLALAGLAPARSGREWVEPRKSEIRISKFETISKWENPNAQNKNSVLDFFV